MPKRMYPSAAMWRPRLLSSAAGALLLLALSVSGVQAARDVPALKVHTEASLQRGFARILLHLDRVTGTSVRQSGHMIVITFDRPVHIDVSKLPVQLQGIVLAARVDPDMQGVRIALRQKLRMSKLEAGERIFIDLLPETWSGEPPPIPQDVVHELAERARQAEAKLKDLTEAPPPAPIPVEMRVVDTPRFTRLSFPLTSIRSPELKVSNTLAVLAFPQVVDLNLSNINSDVLELIRDVQLERETQATSLQFFLAPGVRAQGYVEDDHYMVDLFKPTAAGTEPTPSDLLEALRSKMVAGGRDVAPVVVPDASASSQKSDRPAEVARASAPAQASTESKPSVESQNVPEAQKPLSASAEAFDPLAHVPAELAGPQRQDVSLDAMPAPSVEPTPETAARLSLRVKADLIEAGLELRFPFQGPTPAAVFQRADVLWMMFDTPQPLAWEGEKTSPFYDQVEAEIVEGVQIFRLPLKQRMLAAARLDGDAWVVKLGDQVSETSETITFARQVRSDGRQVVTAAMASADRILSVQDKLVGDTLTVVMGLGPLKSLHKAQRYVDFDVLPSVHGLVIQPFTDDLSVDLALHEVDISRPSGLRVSAMQQANVRVKPTDPMFDQAAVDAELRAGVKVRERELMSRLALSSGTERDDLRLALARTYLLSGFGMEAEGLMNLAMRSDPNLTRSSQWTLARGASLTSIFRSEEALRYLAMHGLDQRPEGAFWRALAEGHLHRWPSVRTYARIADPIASYTAPRWQVRFRLIAARAALEHNDFPEAQRQMELRVSLPKDDLPQQQLFVMLGRIAESYGKNSEALVSYRSALNGTDYGAQAEARYRAINLRLKMNQVTQDETIAELERLTMAWRGDSTELYALNDLSTHYDETGRWREAFTTLRRANEADVRGSPIVRAMHDRLASRFEKLFLEGEADKLPALDALALYYDFNQLTPIGRKGDEMIRRIADRLVQADLLDPAAELLSHQVNHRLTGVARAQVATRLAVIELAAQRPAQALKVLKDTRLPDLPQDLRRARAILEARALADAGRTALALEVLENVRGQDVARMQADMLWRAKRWQDVGEVLEKMLGDTWRRETLLSDAERHDVMRAAIAYVLADDRIGTDRVRSKFAAKMSQTPDAKAFETVTMGNTRDTADFRGITRRVSAVDTLEAFLDDYRKRFPDTPQVRSRSKEASRSGETPAPR